MANGPRGSSLAAHSGRGSNHAGAGNAYTTTHPSGYIPQETFLVTAAGRHPCGNQRARQRRASALATVAGRWAARPNMLSVHQTVSQAQMWSAFPLPWRPVARLSTLQVAAKGCLQSPTRTWRPRHGACQAERINFLRFVFPPTERSCHSLSAACAGARPQ